MSKTILVTGASSGFGAKTVRTLAEAGHTVYAGIRNTTGNNAPAVAALDVYAKARGVDARVVEMDVTDQSSVDTAIVQIIAETDRIDVVVHNAGHMVLGPTEAFTPEQVADIYDVNVLSTQRVNRAALPHMRAARDGLLVWVGSSSSRGGVPPYLAPYFAAKAAEDALAVSYAAELARFGIETTILVPGAFTTGTNHYAHAGHAADRVVEQQYDEFYGGIMDDIPAKQAELSPADADPDEVARQIARVVDLPHGQRPFRVHIDPMHDGAEEVFNLGDRIRTEFFQRLGFADLLTPAAHR